MSSSGVTEKAPQRAGRRKPRGDGAAAAARPVGLLVMGMHRSGTSALTRTLNLLGAALPSDLLGASVNNPLGHWEPRVTYELHNQLLEEIDTRWDDWTPIARDWFQSPAAARYAQKFADFITAEVAEHPLFVLKDPRLCRLAPLWRQAFDVAGCDPRAVFPIRSPLDVAKSLHKRNGMPLPKAMLIWLRYVLDAEAGTRGWRRCFVSYDALLDDWRGVVDDISGRLDLAWPRRTLKAEREIADFLSPEHRHNLASDEELLSAGAHPWVVGAYQALRLLVRDPDSAEAMARLEAIRAALDQAAQAFWPVITDEVAALQARADAQRHQVKSERGEALRQVDQLKSDNDRLASDNAELRAYAQQVEDALRDRAAEVQRVLAEADELRGKIELSSGERWREAAIKAADEIGAKARLMVEEAQGRAAALEAKRLDALEELARTRDALSAVQSENETLAAAEARLAGELGEARDELRRKHKALKAERAVYEQKLAALEQENARIASERSTVKQRAMELKSEREGLRQRLKELGAQIGDMEAAGAALTSELEAVKLDRDGASARLAESSARASASEKERKKLAGELKALNGRLSELKSEVASLRAERQKLMDSPSWRLTRPLRQLTALQRRGRTGG